MKDFDIWLKRHVMRKRKHVCQWIRNFLGTENQLPATADCIQALSNVSSKQEPFAAFYRLLPVLVVPLPCQKPFGNCEIERMERHFLRVLDERTNVANSYEN